MTPFKNLEMGAISKITTDYEGNKIIIDSSAKRLLKIDKAGYLIFHINGGKREEKEFYEATRVLADKENNIYVLDIQRDGQGTKIAEERIMKYSPSGKFLEVVYTEKYEQALAGHITGLHVYKGSFAFTRVKEDAVELCSETHEVLESFPYEKAQQAFVTFEINPVTQELYYVTRRGEIGFFNQQKEPITLYEAKSEEGLNVPRGISFDKEGTLYFTDIGLREICKLTETGKQTVLFNGEVGEEFEATGEERLTAPIYYAMDAQNGLVAVEGIDGVALLDLEGDQVNYITGAKLDHKANIRCVVGALALMIVLIGCVCLGGLLIHSIIKKGSTILKISSLVMIGTLCITGVFCLLVVQNFQDRMVKEMMDRAGAVAHITAKDLPKEEFKRIQHAYDYMGEDYNKVRDYIRSIFLSGDKSISDLYCVLYKVQDGNIVSTYTLEENTGSVYVYDWAYEDSDEQAIMTSKEARDYSSVSNSEGSYILTVAPIIDGDGEAIGLIEVGSDLTTFNKENQQMIIELFLNIMAIAVVVILVSLEVIIFLQARKNYKEKIVTVGDKAPSVELMRIVVFLVFFITNVVTAFLPLYAKRIVEESGGLWGIPIEVWMAIPISAEALFGAIFSIYGTFFIDRMGKRGAALLGSLFMLVGLVGRAVVPNILVFTLGNAVMGCGWGILLLIINATIASGTEEEKNMGFAGYNAACFSGVNCGVVFGAFLLNWFDYSMVFVITAALSLLILLHTLLYFKKTESTLTVQQEEERTIKATQFLRSPRILIFFVALAIPVIACGYYVNYLFPILGSEFGLSETNIGYTYLIHGVCVICCGGALTQYLTKRMDKKYILAIATLLYMGAFVLVANYQTIPILLCTLVILGLADSFGLGVQTSYYTDLEEVAQYGYERSMGMYSLFENLAQTCGSFVFSYVLIIGLKKGLTIITIGLGVLLVLFLACNLLIQNLRKGKKLKGETF